MDDHDAYHPHGLCYLWEPELLWMHAISDGLIGLAYFSIPVALGYLTLKRRDMPFKALFAMFGVFILACGTTHFMAVWNLWHTSYWVSGGIKVITAIASIGTAALLVPLVPRALTLPNAAELIELNQSMEKAQALAHFGNWRWDIASNQVTWSNELHRIYGTNADSFTPTFEEYLDRVHPDDRERVGTTIRTSFETKAPFGLRERIHRPDGEIRFLETVGEPTIAEDGQVVSMSGVCQDVTESMVAQEASQRSERLFRELLEAAPDAMVIVNADGNTVLVNQQTEELFGYSRHELVNRSVDTLLPADLRHLHADHRSNYALNPSVRPMGAGRDLYGQHKNGETFPCEISLSPLQSGQDRLVIATVRDVSARKQLEEQFRQSQKLEAVGLLAGGVAHDFNNLLTAIYSFGHFALQGLQPSDPARADIGEVLSAAKAAESLTRQLLAFSRQRAVEPRVIALAAAVKPTTRMLSRVVGEHIRLHLDLREAGNVVADPTAIEQVLLNLVVNARDAMPDGGTLGVTVDNTTIAASNLDRRHEPITPGDYVTLSVSDSGCGMDEQTRQRIFEPFFTTKEEGQGTGLGLSTAYGIIKQANGFIDVRSKPDAGTTFTLYLPRTRDAAVPVPPVAQASSAGGTETVLVAEDNEKVRALVGRTLRHLGYTVLESADPAEALRRCAAYEKPIQLLLTDVVMPAMNGRELAAAASKLRPDMAVLFMSGHAKEVVTKHGVIAAGVNLLQKPFTPDALATGVRTVLDARSTGRTPATVDPTCRILIIDDEPYIRAALDRALTAAGYTVVTEGGIVPAKARLRRDPNFDVVIVDLNLPDGSGAELYQWCDKETPDLTGRMLFLTGGATTEGDQAFLERHRHRMLKKPIRVPELRQAIAAVTARQGHDGS